MHGNTLPFTNIKPGQWEGLLEKSGIPGVSAGVICWWVDKGVTRWIPIEVLNWCKIVKKMKSIRYDYHPFDERTIISKTFDIIDIQGKKKRVYYDYDMKSFLENFE